MAPRLCEYCEQIPFARLAMPTASEIRKARTAVKAGKPRPIFMPYRGDIVSPPAATTTTTTTGGGHDDYFDTEKADRTVDLGTLGRIRESGLSSCALCHLILGVITRQGRRYLNDWPIPEDDENVHIIAGAPQYGTIWETITGQQAERLFVISRLELSACFMEDTPVQGVTIPAGYALGLYSAVAQPCNLDGEFGLGRPAVEEEDTDEEGKREDVSQDWEDIDDGRMLFCARKRPDAVDFELVKSWISLCQAEHGNICHIDRSAPNLGISDIETPKGPKRRWIRFIDVERDCLTTLYDVDQDSTHYAALSYVWGGDQKVKLTQDNKNALHEPKSLSNAGLLKTITDAIDVTKRLGIKFLWIDALCILQDGSDASKEDRNYQLEIMGSIYSCAFITIIGACGIGADAGLWGLQPGSREVIQEEAVEVIPGKLGLVATCSSQQAWTQKSEAMSRELRREDVDASTWSTRAWTYQERSLSRRCLIFGEGQVFWACDGGTFCEDAHFEHPDVLKGLDRSERDGPLRLDLADTTGSRGALAFRTIDGILAKRWTTSKQFWHRCTRDMEVYSSRKLTHASDVYDAFRSAMEAYAHLSGEKFLWGHPKSQLGLSLLWQPSRDSILVRREVEKNGKLSPHLPSWSWMGWVGTIEINLGEDKLESVRPEVLCFAHQSLPGSEPPRIAMVYSSNRFSSPEPADSDVESAGEPHDSPYLPRRSCLHNKSLDVTWDDIQQQLPSLTAERLRSVADEHMLFFWASSVFLEVHRGTASAADTARKYTGTHSSIRPADIRDSHGNSVGTMERMSHWDRDHSLSGRHEFIALGRQDLGIEALRDIYPSRLVAMQIRWEDGVAYRVNLVEVEQAAWEAAGPVCKLIALQ